jgi:hypothetical protein
MGRHFPAATCCFIMSLTGFSSPSLSLSITTYNNLAAFNAAAGSTTTFNFNESATGPAGDFGDFALSTSDPNIQIEVLNGGPFDGSQYVRYYDAFAELSPFVTVSFDYGISAFGLDYINDDGSSDFSQIIVDGQTFDIGGPLTSGFFGFIIADGLATSFTLVDDPSGGGVLAYANYDNFRYSTSEVPLPAALPLFGTGLGIMWLTNWRRRRSAVTVA